MNLKRVAERTIKPTSNKDETIFENGDTEDIISVILRADSLSGIFTEDFAPYLRGRTVEETAQNAWNFVKVYIRYQKDRPGHERVKSPGKLWEDKKGDCKSFSVFIGSIFQNLGIPYKYRFAHYPNGRIEKDVNHVFPVAIDQGREIPTDAVADFFNYEEPYEYAIDYDPKTGKQATINGTGTLPTWLKVGAAFMIGLFAYRAFNCRHDAN